MLRASAYFTISLALLLGSLDLAHGADPASAAAQSAMAGFRTPAGMKVELFATGPQLGNPVAIGLDERGRVFVAEEYRFNRGTEENRTRPFLLEDDLQTETLDDRLRMFRKHVSKFDGGMEWFTRHSDQIRLLEDRDGDGRADRAEVFAAGFNGPLDGLAAGVLARDGDIYFTCIPNVWRLRDDDGDGRADRREIIAHGFGVNNGFIGHDLHGLVFGPDGRLYFSVGDRGFHVETKEGPTLHGPRTGAVFRCEPDGSRLEVLHRGLRNPQEIAFDEFGNLFAADNNCDKGDRSRLVYVVEGGESGWNMAFQSLNAPYQTGPWHAEKMWYLRDAQQPAWIVPAVGHLGAGPGGFAYYPGLGLSERYRGHFFMANYTGDGGIEAFAVRPTGASFAIVDYHDVLKPVRATDVEFGYDGKLYVSDLPTLDWVNAASSGSVYTLFDPTLSTSSAVQQVKQLFAAGIVQRPLDELVELLEHADLRVRQRAQFALVAKGAAGIASLSKLLDAKHGTLTRRHAAWGLWQAGRNDPAVLAALTPLLSDADAELRAQAVRILGDCGHSTSAAKIVSLLQDESPRVRFFAAEALGKLKHSAAIEPLFELVKANNDEDVYLRHAAVVALERIGKRDEVWQHARDESPAVRLAVILVLRRWRDPRVAEFLNDRVLSLATEAARAINDLPLDEATAALAQQLSRASGAIEEESLIRRAIHAQFRLGTAANAVALAKYVADEKQATVLRAEALAALADWSTPSQRDRVTGFWRPLASRDPAVVREALKDLAAELLAHTTGELQSAVVKLIVKHDIPTDDETFFAWVSDRERRVDTRIEALRLLSARKHSRLPAAVAAALDDNQPRLRAEARDVLVAIDPAAGLKQLERVVGDSQAAQSERQRAFATLGGLKLPQVETLLLDWAQRLANGSVPAELALDVIEACEQHVDPAIQAAVLRFKQASPLPGRQAKFQVSLVGGDTQRGQELFTGNSTAQCVRCHTVRGAGGKAGPDLSAVATRLKREELLQSLLDPSAKIAPGFGTVNLLLANGQLVAGMVKAEDQATVTIETAEGKRITVKQSEIDDRSNPTSPMPSIERALSPREVRDLVEFLSTLK